MLSTIIHRVIHRLLTGGRVCVWPSLPS